ncbi:uncharacterized protein LOC135343884 isoform X2 [Halichondria panicea]|uniref:uncharacterized protein LOC135343884 isoform X2 n=1 Tax=Halichondria panicea TaxID=6063 RepID=UPI00312B52E6
MKLFTLSLLYTVFSLSTAKRRIGKLRGHFDDMGYFHKSEMGLLQASSMASVQQSEPGREICQSATYSHIGLTTYVHICESGFDSQGKKQYCFVSDGLCCIPPSFVSIPPTPVKGYILKLSDQFSTSVNFYSASGSRGVCYDIENEDVKSCSGCRPGECDGQIRCIQNTLTGNMDSCNNVSCVCKEGFAPPDCCSCDLTGVSGRPHYLDPVTNECTIFCRENCPQPALDGCDQCTVGYKPRDCCQCEDGYFDKQGICSIPCVDNVDKCVNGECSCKSGYLSPDCCECAPGYYKDPVDKKCKLPECQRNLKAPCVDGACTCIDGYLPQDCCECAPDYYKDGDECKLPACDNIKRCFGGVCTCEENYLPPDCCDCEKGLYESPDGTCLEPCVENTVSCTRGVCTCNVGFSGDDCCTESCTPAQDVYLLIDATASYITPNFCRTQYSTQLMISALNPGSSLTTGTRLGVVMYPTIRGDDGRFMDLRDEPREAIDLLNVGMGCTEAVGKFNNLIDGFMNVDRATPVSPYVKYTKSLLTYPATAFELLNTKLNKAILNGEKKDRRRVVIVITDGANDESTDTDAQRANNPKLEEQIKKLREISNNPSINIIAAGRDGYGSDIQGRNQFMKDLETIAGDKNNVVVDSNPLELSRKLIQKMIDLNTICKSDCEKILESLQDTNNVNSFCYCVLARNYGDNFPVCRRYCTDKTTQQCRAPPQCPGGPAGINNPWYVGSKNYGDSVTSVVRHTKIDTKNELEEEILAALEEILKERMSN